MRKISSGIGRGNTRKRLLFRITLLAVMLMVGFSSVFAKLEVLDVLHAFDFVSQKFENGNARVTFDGSYVPFFQQLNFDTNPFDTTGTDPVSGVPYGGTCSSTTWAGVLEHGLYEIDNNPAGAVGFQTTRKWTLVACDRDGDGDYDNADKALLPPYIASGTWTTYDPPNGVCASPPGPTGGNTCSILQQDLTAPCSTGNCATEVVTRVYVNLDRDCNGTPDVPVPPGGLCLYWEAETPDCVNGTANNYCLVDPSNPSLGFLPAWGGNYQGRVNAGGGDKTINFNISYVPLGVTLADFYAEQVADFVRLTWETNSELNNRGFNLYRDTPGTPGDRPRQLNETLIPSQSQGNPGGFIYTWEDRADLVPGTTYYYWVEDVDIYGATTMHGPVSVDYTGPTAVTVSSVQASPAATSSVLPMAGIMLALLAPLAGALALRRRRA